MCLPHVSHHLEFHMFMAVVLITLRGSIYRKWPKIIYAKCFLFSLKTNSVKQASFFCFNFHGMMNKVGMLLNSSFLSKKRTRCD